MIEVGDKVMLVYVGCGCTLKLIGVVSEVREIRLGRAYCTHCLARTALGAHVVIQLDDHWVPVPISWVRKLPPDTERIDNDVTEPCAAI